METSQEQIELVNQISELEKRNGAMKESNFELMRPLSEDRKRFWEKKLRTELEQIKLRKKARAIDLETLQCQHNKLEAELAGARNRVRQACMVAGNKLQLDKNRLASELELTQGLLVALNGNVRWQQNASQAWVNLSGVDSLCFMNSFDNIEEAKLVCTELNYLRHSYFPQRTLITNINGKSFVGFVIHGVSIANFLQKERNRFFDEWDEVKVQPSDFYIQIIRALIDGVYLMKDKDIVAMIDQNHVFIEEDNENNPHISFVKYSKRKSKESEGSIQDLQFVNKLICMINESLGVSEDLMDPFLKKLDQFNRLDGDFNTLCEDPILMTSKDKIEFVCELSCIFEAKKWMVLDQCNDDGFDNFEDIVSKDARLNFLKHVLRVFVDTNHPNNRDDTNHPNNRERNNDDANSNMAFRVRFMRNSYAHFWRIVLNFGAEALGFRSLKELQLLFERHFPRAIRSLQLVYKNLKSQLAVKSFKIFIYGYDIGVLADEGLQASKLTLKLLCEKVDKTEAERQNLNILLKAQIKEETVPRPDIFGSGRRREEVLQERELQERESKSPGACRMREQLHGGRPNTWLETGVLEIMRHLEESCISATKAEQESILRKLRIWKEELNKLIVQTNGSFRYC